MKFLEGIGWTAYLLFLLGLACVAIVGTVLAFNYVFGENWGVPILTLTALLIGGGIIHATGNENST